MLMTKDDPDAAGWAISVLQEAGAIRECDEHGWSRTASIRMPASAPSSSPARIRRSASLRTRPWPRFGTRWTRSATPAWSARRLIDAKSVPCTFAG